MACVSEHSEGLNILAEAENQTTSDYDIAGHGCGHIKLYVKYLILYNTFRRVKDCLRGLESSVQNRLIRDFRYPWEVEVEVVDLHGCKPLLYSVLCWSVECMVLGS